MVGKRRMPELRQDAEVERRAVGQRLLRVQHLEAVHPPREQVPAVDSGQAVGVACS